MTNTSLGMFFGIGVGPGASGLIPVAAVAALKESDIVYLPKSKGVSRSIASLCIADLKIPEEKLHSVDYNMDPDRESLRKAYKMIAEEIAKSLREGKTVSYLTIGDSLTYSTYSYTLEALLDLLPDLKHKTFPGITSYAAAAAALDFPLGQGKERVLILPCPDEMEILQKEIETNDIVVLMKIGHRLKGVLELLSRLDIEHQCGFVSNLGLPGEVICQNVELLDASDENIGYLSTMLIKCKKIAKKPVCSISKEMAEA